MTASPTLAVAEGLSRDFLFHHGVCPARLTDAGALVVLISPDGAAEVLDDIAWAYGLPVVAEQVSRADVEQSIERLSMATERRIELQRAGVDDEAGDDGPTDVRDLANEPPVVRYVNLLVREAYDAGASDIHLEATRAGLAARFRLDGILTAAPEPPAELHHAVVSRVKLLAELDIAERRRPQDGRIRVRLEARELDLRVSTVPTMHGESLVLRLLDRGGRPVCLGDLGLSDAMLSRIETLVRRPHGMFLVTGPTGSGKTTTLYAALQSRRAEAEKIITVEDPVEYQLPGTTQVPVHRGAGVTFGAALRAILRQDPDVVMIGEMRDQETAEIAVQAAMTGHLVLSTLHTNDAVSSVPRLLDLGIPGYLVSATLEGILAQRLVRRTCDACKVEYQPAPTHVAALSDGTEPDVRFLRGSGCPRCRGTGFRGRIGIFELLIMTDQLRAATASGRARDELNAMAIAAGLVPIRVDAWEKAKMGLTTLEEVLRVVQD